MCECGCVKMCVCVPPAYLRSVVYVYLFYLSLRPCRRFSTPRLSLPRATSNPLHFNIGSIATVRVCICIIQYYNMHIRHFEKKKCNNQSLIFAHRRFLKLPQLRHLRPFLLINNAYIYARPYTGTSVTHWHTEETFCAISNVKPESIKFAYTLHVKIKITILRQCSHTEWIDRIDALQLTVLL